jgi:hypothetical protein
MEHKRAFIVDSRIASLLSEDPYSFSHRGNLQGCEVFNEVEPMCPEAIIKAFSPKTLSMSGRNS